MKKKSFLVFISLFFLVSCKEDFYQEITENPKIELKKPANFPDFRADIEKNFPTKYGVELGKKLFFDTRLSVDNTISCGKCHQKAFAYTDPAEKHTQRAVGVFGLIGLRNTPSIQNAAFLNSYMWDGVITDLTRQPLIPIITEEEMGETIANVEKKLQNDPIYRDLFKKVFGSEEISREKIFRAIAQFMLTFISAESKFDRVTRDKTENFSILEQKGYEIFNQKCASCHSGSLFTDESFRNIGIAKNPDPIVRRDDTGVHRFSGNPADDMKFKVPSLRNVGVTAPYGHDGSFATLNDFLEFLNSGVQNYPNLDPLLKNRPDGQLGIAISAEEKEALIAFLHTLTDDNFISN